MIQHLPRTFFTLLILLIVLTSTGCAFVSLKNWFEANGQVIYLDNTQPVPNALIAAVWRGKNMDTENGDPICYHVETTRTDNDGAFKIPAWKEYFEYGNISEKKLFVVIYKPGFWTQQTLLLAPSDSQVRKYRIESISDQNRQTVSKYRLRYLQKIVGLTSCNITGANRPKLQELYTAILAEAEDIAQTPKDKKIVESLRNWTSFVAAKS
ncbi:MAG: hypothetical protein ACC707_11670 [Thiohalomonadales bacterium]